MQNIYQIHTNTYKYMPIHTNTCQYIQIHANTNQDWIQIGMKPVCFKGGKYIQLHTNTCWIHANTCQIQTGETYGFRPRLYSDFACILMYSHVFACFWSVLICILQTRYQPILDKWRNLFVIGLACIGIYAYVLFCIAVYWHILIHLVCINW